MIFSNSNIFNVDEFGKIIASKIGSSMLTYYRDGKSATVNIVIKWWKNGSFDKFYAIIIFGKWRLKWK